MWQTVHCGKYCTQHTLHNTQCVQVGRELFFLLWDDDEGGILLFTAYCDVLFCSVLALILRCLLRLQKSLLFFLSMLLLLQQIHSVGLLSPNSEKTKYHTIYSRHLYNVSRESCLLLSSGKPLHKCSSEPKFITLFSSFLLYRLKPRHVNSIKQKYIDLFTDNRKVKPLKA